MKKNSIFYVAAMSVLIVLLVVNFLTFINNILFSGLYTEFIIRSLVLLSIIVATIVFIVLSLNDVKKNKVITKNAALMLFIAVLIFVSLTFVLRTYDFIKYFIDNINYLSEADGLKKHMTLNLIDSVIKYIVNTAEFVILLILSIFCLKGEDKELENKKSSLEWTFFILACLNFHKDWNNNRLSICLLINNWF